MITIEYKSGEHGYVWSNPPKKPKEFYISRHWPDRCSTTKWWGRLSTPNAFKQRTRGWHRHLDNQAAICKSLFILNGLEILVVDDGIEYLCKLTKVHRRRCEVIARAEIIEERGCIK